MTRGNQRDKDRERAQARAAKNNKTGNSCTGQQKLDQADIMRQKQAAAEAKKAAAAVRFAVGPPWSALRRVEGITCSSVSSVVTAMLPCWRLRLAKVTTVAAG